MSSEVTRSGRVRKKSTKLMEMEEVETTEKQGDKKSSTLKRTPKVKAVKLKMTIGGAPICEVVEECEIPIAEYADLCVEEEPQLEVVTEEPLPLPPITMKLSASKGTSQLGAATIKTFEVVSDKRPSSRSDCESETPKQTNRKRKITSPETDGSVVISPDIATKPTPNKKSRKSVGGAKMKKPGMTTGYTLWTKENRPKIQQEHPEMDFASVSRRLGEIWQGLSNNEKLHWKVKAQKLAGKMSSTGPTVAEAVSPAIFTSPTIRQPTPKQRQTLHNPPLPQLAELPATNTENKMRNIPMLVATHLKVLGESMSSIGYKLSHQDTQQDISGPMSDLLDSLLCSLNSLMLLTSMDQKLNGCSISTHSRAMENTAYIMPGI